MRIIGGTHRSRRLVAPRGRGVRPTSDRARETLFDILGERVRGASFLDLFAGTGAVGLEALSRGAHLAVFVEREGQALAALEKNIRALDLADRSRVLRDDWQAGCRHLAREGASFDIVFADPPYGRGLAESCLLSPCLGDILKPDGELVIEHQRRELLPEPPATLARVRRRQAGEAAFSIYRKEEEA